MPSLNGTDRRTLHTRAALFHDRPRTWNRDNRDEDQQCANTELKTEPEKREAQCQQKNTDYHNCDNARINKNSKAPLHKSDRRARHTG
jgi:hypothetical protein